MIEQTLKDEENLLGGILCNPETIYQAAEFVDSKSFLSDGFGLVFQAIQTMLQIGVPITRSNVAVELVRVKAVDAIGGPKRLIELLTDGQPHHVSYYAEIVAKHSKRRNLMAFIDRIKAKSIEANCDPMELAGEMSQALGIMGGESDQQKQIGKLVIDFLEDCERIKTDGGQMVFATGIEPLDSALDGGFPAGTITIGARPSIGKSAFGSEVCYRMAKSFGKPTLFVSLEMNFRQMASRFVLRGSNMRVSDLNRLSYTNEQLDAAMTKALQDSDTPMEFWHKPSGTIAQIEGRIRSDVARRGCRCVVVDYLQLIRAPGYSDPKLRVSFVMKELVRISKELMIPVVVLAQVGRQAEGTMPTLSDLKESGSVEEDSDTVILLHREKRDSEELLCEVAKQRNGEIAKLTLAMRNGVVMAVSEVATEFHNDFVGY